MRGKKNQYSIKEDGKTLSHFGEPVIEMNKTNLVLVDGQRKGEG